MIANAVKGPLQKCRGCGRTFQCNSELRVHTSVIHKPNGYSPYLRKIYFCCNGDCIQKAINKDSIRQDLEINYPKYEGYVRVPEELVDSPLLKPFKVQNGLAYLDNKL